MEQCLRAGLDRTMIICPGALKQPSNQEAPNQRSVATATGLLVIARLLRWPDAVE